TKAVACQHYKYTVRAIASGSYSNYDANGLYIKFMPLNGAWSKAVTYNFYNYAVDKVSSAGAAGYTLKAWQDSKITVKAEDEAFAAMIQESLDTEFKKQQTATYKKGSAEAKTYFPKSTVAYSHVKSATCTKKGNNYLIKMVFVDVKDPSGNDPISKTSPNSIDMIAWAKDLNKIDMYSNAKGTASYTGYTVTAEITADGKIVSMTHTGPCKASLSMDVEEMGTVKVDMSFTFRSQYSSFKY
ncbi:MAG: hypothetical protein IKV44_03250, partial [Clostridia bacterium]|nr:hypothetical protein [Clostridia bacterium]